MLISPAGICSKRSGRSGFTLLEIVVVIFIISLFAAVVLPSFTGIGADGLKTEARKLASLLRYLNDSATYNKQTYTLTFDFHEKTMSWEGPDGSRSQDLGKITSVFLPSKGVVREGQLSVKFGPLGLRENIEITLDNKDRQEMKVGMNSLSGRVKITSNEAGNGP